VFIRYRVKINENVIALQRIARQNAGSSELVSVFGIPISGHRPSAIALLGRLWACACRVTPGSIQRRSDQRRA
jgi:hypothetical protein